MMIKKATDKEYREHLTASIRPTSCLVCNSMLVGDWTDVHGQFKCLVCGVTYQDGRVALPESTLKRLNITKDQVRIPYCDCYTLINLCRAYWKEAGDHIPFGHFVSVPPFTQEQYDKFYKWIANHRDILRVEFPDTFNWELIMEDYGD